MVKRFRTSNCRCVIEFVGNICAAGCDLVTSDRAMLSRATTACRGLQLRCFGENLCGHLFPLLVFATAIRSTGCISTQGHKAVVTVTPKRHSVRNAQPRLPAGGFADDGLVSSCYYVPSCRAAGPSCHAQPAPARSQLRVSRRLTFRLPPRPHRPSGRAGNCSCKSSCSACSSLHLCNVRPARVSQCMITLLPISLWGGDRGQQGHAKARSSRAPRSGPRAASLRQVE
jgi:hypothetical protein